MPSPAHLLWILHWINIQNTHQCKEIANKQNHRKAIDIFHTPYNPNVRYLLHCNGFLEANNCGHNNSGVWTKWPKSSFRSHWPIIIHHCKAMCSVFNVHQVRFFFGWLYWRAINCLCCGHLKSILFRCFIVENLNWCKINNDQLTRIEFQIH